MRAITHFLITRRDTAADAWLKAIHTGERPQHHQRWLERCDAILGAWTRNGTRWT